MAVAGGGAVASFLSQYVIPPVLAREREGGSLVVRLAYITKNTVDCCGGEILLAGSCLSNLLE